MIIEESDAWHCTVCNRHVTFLEILSGHADTCKGIEVDN